MVTEIYGVVLGGITGLVMSDKIVATLELNNQ